MSQPKHTPGPWKTEPMMEYGFKDFNGNAWPNAWVDSYNNYSREINAATYGPTIEYLLNNRHKFFVQCLDLKRKANG